MDQCQVATAAGQNCGLPNSFSLVAALNGNPAGPGLHILERKFTSSAKFFAFIVNQLSGNDGGLQKPVSAEVDFATLIHFVAITGIDPSTTHVWVADPFPGGDPVEFEFNAFLENYYFMDNNGQLQQSNGIVQALQSVTPGTRSAAPAAKFDVKSLPADAMEAATETVAEALLNFSTFNSASADLRRMLPESAQAGGQALPVFTLKLADILDGGRGLEGAHPGGWRIAARSGDAVIAADIYAGSTGRSVYSNDLQAGVIRLACVRTGAEILKMLNKIQQLSQPPLPNGIPEQPYYTRLLFLPGMVTDAVWLVPQDPAQKVSYIAPFNTLIKTFDTETVCDSARFIEIVRPLAEYWKQYGEQYPPSDSRY